MATKVGKPNLWILKSQTDIMEVYAPFITKPILNRGIQIWDTYYVDIVIT
jgi:hypothetical protein